VSNWNYADVWETVAEVQPDAVAVVQGDRTVSWAAFDRGADGLARCFLEAGAMQQDKVALYLYNSPEYLQTLFGVMKAGLVPVNTNYRYGDDELLYLWDNADAMAVVFHGTFSERIAALIPRLQKVRAWLWVDDGSGPCPPWAVPYEEAASSAPSRTVPPWGRSGDDLFMLYTGGTTGMPKGVMWRQDDLFARLNSSGLRHYDDEKGVSEVRRQITENGPGMTLLPACPLMHGTGGFTANLCLSDGGRVVLLSGRKYDATEMLDAIAREKVNALVLVGDPFSRPMLAALDDNPGHWDLSSLIGITSSGAMWSEEIKQGLLGHHPQMLLVDAFSSSEALGMGSSVSSSGGAAATATFVLGPEVKVLTTEGQQVEPGSDDIGVLCLGGRNPLGYYKDEKKSAATFKIIDGERYSVPGDFAQVRADGSIHLLGRGSMCINTAGEKVFPEEVEEALKTHPDVRDAVVVGVPHPTYGEQIVASVELNPDIASVDEDAVIKHVKGSLASYKAPRRVRVVDTIGRAANGKVDYGRHRDEAIDWVSTPV
jgi:3-oxocholest-4-en-26-oate---CoA ligase